MWIQPNIICMQYVWKSCQHFFHNELTKTEDKTPKRYYTIVAWREESSSVEISQGFDYSKSVIVFRWTDWKIQKLDFYTWLTRLSCISDELGLSAVICNAICGKWWIKGFHRFRICTLGSLMMLWFAAMSAVPLNFLFLVNDLHPLPFYSLVFRLSMICETRFKYVISRGYGFVAPWLGLLVFSWSLPHKDIHICRVCCICNSLNQRSCLVLSLLWCAVMFWRTWTLSVKNINCFYIL